VSRGPGPGATLEPFGSSVSIRGEMDELVQDRIGVGLDDLGDDLRDIEMKASAEMMEQAARIQEQAANRMWDAAQRFDQAVSRGIDVRIHSDRQYEVMP
jgi:hypothetical protein